MHWNHKAIIDFAAFVGKNYDAHGHLYLSCWRLLLDIALIGVFGGLFIVPLYALIQTRSEKSHQSRVIAANNIINALFMVISAVFSILILKQDLNIQELFLTTALLNVLVVIYLCFRQPEYYKSFISWVKFKK